MRISQLIAALTTVSLVAAGACQKTKSVAPPASFTVIDAMMGSNTIVPRLGADTVQKYYNASYGTTMVQVGYGSSQLYSPVAGTVPFLVVPITDTFFQIFNGKVDLVSGGIYSFFLSGDTAHADTMLVRDNLPYYSDSSAGVRFVNLSVGGKALTINLTGENPSNLQFPAIGYKQITEFKKYNANTSVGGSYSFDIRDQASGDSLTTYTWYYAVHFNNTIVLSGDPLDPAQFLVFSVNNF